MEPFGTFSTLPMILAVLLVTIVIAWRTSRRRLYTLAHKIETIKSLKYNPILGHAHHFLCDTEGALKLMVKMAQPLELACLWLVHRAIFVVGRADEIQSVLNSQNTMTRDDVYLHTIPITGNGLLTLDVPQWKKHRRALMPAFGIKILDQYVNIFSKSADLMANNLLKNKKFDSDIFICISECNLSIVSEVAMGVNIDKEINDADLVSKFIRAGDIILMKMYNFLYNVNFIFNLTSYSREEKAIAKEYHDLTRKIINQRKEDYAEMLKNDTVQADRTKFFLDIMMESTQKGMTFTAQEIEDEVNTFMIAGSDTSATATSFFLLSLALNQNVQENVYNEVMDVLGPNRLPTSEDLNKFEYMEKAIKESMRFFPVVPNILRKVTSDFQLGNHVLPKGSAILISIMCIHKHPKYYENPLQFDPERFNQDEVAKRHPYTYLPFSAGPRNCIGLQFAMRVMKTMSATMIRRFRFETSYKSMEEVRLKQSVFLKPVLGFQVKLIPRTEGNQV